MPLPLPLLPDVIEIQGALLAAVQLQPVCVVIEKLPLEPAPAIFAAGWTESIAASG